MANTLNNTLDKVGSAIETILGGSQNRWETVKNPQITNGQTCLERFGIDARKEHLQRNEWKRDLQYTKTLVDAEYLVQTEFNVSSYEDNLIESTKQQTVEDLRKQKERLERKLDMIENNTKPSENLLLI